MLEKIAQISAQMPAKWQDLNNDFGVTSTEEKLAWFLLSCVCLNVKMYKSVVFRDAGRWSLVLVTWLFSYTKGEFKMTSNYRVLLGWNIFLHVTQSICFAPARTEKESCVIQKLKKNRIKRIYKNVKTTSPS